MNGYAAGQNLTMVQISDKSLDIVTDYAIDNNLTMHAALEAIVAETKYLDPPTKTINAVVAFIALVETIILITLAIGAIY